jgi:WD40 repeat protein
VSSDGTFVALAHRPGEVLIYRIASPGTEAVEQCRFAAKPPIAFSPDGTWILTGGPHDGFQKVDVRSGKVIRSFQADLEAVRGFALSPNGQLAVCYVDGLPLLDLESGQLIPTEGITHSRYEVPQVGFSPDGQRLALPGRDRRLNIWDTTTRSLITSFDVSAIQIRFSEDGQRITAIGPQGAIRVLDGSPWDNGKRSPGLGRLSRRSVKD